MPSMFGNVYDFRKWSDVTTAKNTNGYIFTELKGYGNCYYPTDSDETYEKFLKECDISHSRQEYNRKELFNIYKEKIRDSHDLNFWGWLFGEKYVDKLVTEYIKKHKLLRDDEYPFWKFPIIKCVHPSTFQWRFNESVRKFQCLNEDLLLDYARECDFLLVGTCLMDQWVVTNHRPLKWYPAEPTESFLLTAALKKEESHMRKAHVHVNYRKGYVSPFMAQLPERISRCYTKDVKTEDNWDVMMLTTKMTNQDIIKNPSLLKPAHISP
jgi:hypothetical protein